MRSAYAIPFNRPSTVGNELEYVRDAIERNHISGDGYYTSRCETLLSELHSGARALLTTSCTDALELAALLLNLEQGDEFIVPSFTFVSTANAFVLRGARPRFADIRSDTLNLDEARLSGLINKRTRCIIVVHYGGIACAMDQILGIAEAHGLPVIEDNAHGLFARYRGQPLGTIGSISTLSFHETKNIFCGEGGALVLNSAPLVERAEILRDKGTNRRKFLRGQVDKYTWQDVGSSFAPSDILAAFLFAQLERRDAIQSARRRVWERYRDDLSSWAEQRGVALPFVPTECEPAFHLFHLLLRSEVERNAFIEHMRLRGVQAIFHYVPLNCSPMGQQLGGRPGDCPVAESVSQRVVRLPFYSSMTDTELTQVIDAVRAF